MVGKKLGKKVLAAIILSVFLLGNGAFVVFCENIDELQLQSQELQKKHEDIKCLLEETKNQVEKKKEYSQNLNNQITNLQQQVSIVSKNISILDKQILDKQAEIESRQVEIEKNIEFLKQRVKAVYIAGDIYTIDIILGAKDFKDFLDKAEIVSKMSQRDSMLIQTLNDDIHSIEKQKEEIEASRANVAAEKELLAQKNKELTDLFEENDKILKELYGKQLEEQTCLDEFNEEYKKIQNKIEEYYKEQRRIAEEQARKAGKKSIVTDTVPIIEGKYSWPVPGFTKISSYFNEKRGDRYHKGIDVCGSGIYGKNVISVDEGKVLMAYSGCTHDFCKDFSYNCGCAGGYGNFILVDHGSGKATLYAHLSSVLVSVGDTVNKSQVIGKVGTTGHSTGPHLHFETRFYGEKYDPLSEYKR